MTEEFIPTRGSAIKSKNQVDFKCVIFESHKSKKRNKTEQDPRENGTKPTQSEHFNIKRAKHEIIKFGTSGFDPQKKEEAKIQLAIKLGAKPPKNKYKNYKLLQKEQAEQKASAKEKSNFQQLGKNALGKSTAKGKSFDRKRKKNKDGILDMYGKVKTRT